MSLYCLLQSPVAKLRITTRRQSMCQHLHTFTQQVSEAASYVFFTCKHLNVCANRADGQTVGCPTALRVLLHAKRSCSAGQSSRCWSPSTSKVCLPHQSLVHWADHCQLGPKQRRLRRDQCGVVCNPTALYASLRGTLEICTSIKLGATERKTELSRVKQRRYPDFQSPMWFSKFKTRYPADAIWEVFGGFGKLSPKPRTTLDSCFSQVR